MKKQTTKYVIIFSTNKRKVTNYKSPDHPVFMNKKYFKHINIKEALETKMFLGFGVKFYLGSQWRVAVVSGWECCRSGTASAKGQGYKQTDGASLLGPMSKKCKPLDVLSFCLCFFFLFSSFSFFVFDLISLCFRMEPRKLPPHHVEVDAIQQNSTKIFHKIHFPNDTMEVRAGRKTW